MELILNDFSVVGQFASYDEFADYVIKTLGPVLDLVIENQIPFYKKQNFYDCKITKDMSLNDILMLTGDPVIYKIRSYISQLGYQRPYWDEDIMSQSNVSYTYPEKADEPNCFTEVIERRGVLFSFPFLKYDSDVFECKREDEDISVQNVKEKKSFLNTYLLDDVKNIRYILERYPFERGITLATYEKKCYAEEALLKNDLKMEDMQRIVLAIPRMIEGFARGETFCSRKIWNVTSI